MSIQQAIRKEIQALLPEYTDFLARIVQINSSYGYEKQTQEYIENRLSRLVPEVARVYCRPDSEAVNLNAVIKGKDNQRFKSLILNAHSDVAPVDKAGNWEKAPFSGEICEDKVWGRGALDDKAGVTLMLLIVHVIKNLRLKLNGDLIIQVVIEDETSGGGSKALVEKGYTADGVIIIDGTWSERIIYGHLGQVEIHAEIKGEPVAACVEERGINPVYIGMDFIECIKSYLTRLNSAGYSYENITRPYYLNVGTFYAGVWHGSVPAKAEIGMQLGFPDSCTPEEMFAELQSLAAGVSGRIHLKRGLLSTPAFKTRPDNLLIHKLKGIIERNTQKEVLTTAITGFCDMRYFPTEQICLYGPGGGKNPHGVNEYYLLEKLPLVAANILDFMLEWCNENK